MAVPLKAHVELLNPMGGDTYSPGDSVNVSWSEIIAHNTFNWDLLFSSDGGLNWDTVKADIPVEEMSYWWTVPVISTVKGQIKIVQDNDQTDYDGISPNFTILSPSGTSDPLQIVQLKIYPNPMVDFASIEFENPMHLSHTLTIYDTQGRVVRSMPNITSNKVKIEKLKLFAGLYYLRLRNEHEIRAVGNLVIQ